MDNSLQIVKRKGLIETFYQGYCSLVGIIISKIKILWLNIRGYDIDFSASLAGRNIFFQSHRKAINLEKNTKIGLGAKITAGFGGEIKVMENTAIFDYTIIDIQNRLEIGRDCLVAPFCYITDYDHVLRDKNLPIIKQGYKSSPIVIGNNVWLGTHVIVLKGVKIGDNCVIGAGSVVISDIPANSLAAGVPAKVIKKI